jgi:chromosome segregation ATPase
MNGGAALFLTFLLLFGTIMGGGYLISEYTDTLKDLEQAREQVLQLQQQLAEQEAQRQSLAGALQQAQAALVQTTAERDEALQNIQRLTQQINDLTSQAQGSQEQVQRLQAELANWQRRAADLEAGLKVTTEREQGYVSAAITLASEKAALEDQLKSSSAACGTLAAGLPAIDLDWMESLAPGLLLTLANLLILGIFILNRLYTRAAAARTNRP